MNRRRCSNIYPAGLIAASLLLFFPIHAIAQNYDIALVGGTVIDPETGLNAIRSVGITGKQIVAVGEAPVSAAKVIDVTGLVVAPGFIDLHSHGQHNEANRFQAMDGVTTALDLEVGAYPLAHWYESRTGKAVINFGASVSHAGVRAKILHLIDTGHMSTGGIELVTGLKALFRSALRDERLAEMIAITQSELAEGGLGIGLAAQYFPAMAPRETSSLFEIAGKRESTVFVHAKWSGESPPNTGLNAVKELISKAQKHNAGIHIAHITSTALGDTKAALAIIKAANSPAITTELYPYRALATTIQSAYFDPGWQERYGMTYSDITFVETGESLTAETFNDIRRKGGMVVARSIPESALESALRDPAVAIAADAVAFKNGKGHPRAAGTFARVLGEFVREREWLTLEQAIRKMTLIPADILSRVAPQMNRKGRIQVGADADITVFDPTTVKDNATYVEPAQTSTGIQYVIVNGEILVSSGKFREGIYPGTEIRGTQNESIAEN